MSSEILNSPPCCADPCCDGQTTNIPGVPGENGADGAPGANGENAFTTLTAGFVQPAELGDVVVTVASTEWMVQREGSVQGQIVYVQFAGYFEVRAVTNATTATLRNLEDTANGLYPDNASPGANIPSGARVSPGGSQGVEGPVQAGAFLIANDLSEGDPSAMRSSLGLGSLATQNTVSNSDWAGIPLSVPNGGTGATNEADARINLGVVIGTDVQAYDAGLQSLSALPTTADRIAYSTAVNVWAETAISAFGRILIASADAATARSNLGIAGGYSFRAYQTAPQGFANVTPAQVTYDAEEFDDDGVWGSNQFIAPVDGRFFFKAQVFWTGFPGAAELTLEFRVNGVAVSATAVNASELASGDAGISHSDLLEVETGDTVQVWASQTSGGGESTNAASSLTFVTGWLVQQL